jgi:hypothetical protein
MERQPSTRLPVHGLVPIDARGVVTGAISGSADVAHDGELQALVASQTTLSASAGLSFDTLMIDRETR